MFFIGQLNQKNKNGLTDKTHMAACGDIYTVNPFFTLGQLMLNSLLSKLNTGNKKANCYQQLTFENKGASRQANTFYLFVTFPILTNKISVNNTPLFSARNGENNARFNH